jgi:hypothetical protein
VNSNKPPIAGSDGSVDIITGANAAAYKVYTGKEVISGEQRCPDNEYITSYRSELHGEYLASKCIAENVTNTIRQVCDNKRAVEAIKRITHNPTRMLDPEADLILAIKHERDKSTRPSEPEYGGLKAIPTRRHPITSYPTKIKSTLMLFIHLATTKTWDYRERRTIRRQWSNAHTRWKMGHNRIQDADSQCNHRTSP